MFSCQVIWDLISRTWFCMPGLHPTFKSHSRWSTLPSNYGHVLLTRLEADGLYSVNPLVPTRMQLLSSTLPGQATGPVKFLSVVYSGATALEHIMDIKKKKWSCNLWKLSVDSHLATTDSLNWSGSVIAFFECPLRKRVTSENLHH